MVLWTPWPPLGRIMYVYIQYSYDIHAGAYTGTNDCRSGMGRWGSRKIKYVAVLSCGWLEALLHAFTGVGVGGMAAAPELLEDSLAKVRSQMAQLERDRSDACRSLSAAQAKVDQLGAKAELLSNDEKSELGDAQRAVEFSPATSSCLPV